MPSRTETKQISVLKTSIDINETKLSIKQLQNEDNDEENCSIRKPKNLSELPILCISKIFENLTIRERFQMLTVCQSWKSAIDQWCLANKALYLFDNNSMLRDYIYRKSHLYNIDSRCENHCVKHLQSIVPNIDFTAQESRKWIKCFPNINELSIGSPWYFDRELYLQSWNLRSLTLYTEKQSPEDLEKLFKIVENIKTLRKLILFNTGACLYLPIFFGKLFKRLDTFGIFDYRHENINDILSILQSNNNALKSLIFDNVRLLSIPELPQLKEFTYGWTDRSEDCSVSWLTILREVPSKCQNLQSFTCTTKYGLEVIEQINNSALSEMEALTKLKLYIHYQRTCFNNPSLSRSTKSLKLSRKMRFITSLHIYFMPTIKVQEDFCAFISAFFPQLKSFHIHSPNHPFSYEEILCMKRKFKHIDFQLFRHPIS